MSPNRHEAAAIADIFTAANKLSNAYAVESVVTKEIMSVLARYEPDTGKLFWLERPLSLFSEPRFGRSWNKKYAGSEAMTWLNDGGYLCGAIFGKKVRAHRVAWLLAHGEWPTNQIDHINGIRSDNRLVNLRDVSASENSKNTKLYCTSKTGVPGVNFYPKTGRWMARVWSNRKSIFLGYYVSFEDAVAARKKAEASMKFHPNNGRAS